MSFSVNYPNNFTKIWDLVRGMISYETISQIVNALRVVQEDKSNEVLVVNCWNRFKVVPEPEWADVMFHVCFKEAKLPMICEVQLCLWKLTLARKKLGGHDAYAKFRNAGEIDRFIQNVNK